MDFMEICYLAWYLFYIIKTVKMDVCAMLSAMSNYDMENKIDSKILK